MNATPLPSRPVIKQVKKEFNRDESVIVNKRNPFQDLDTNKSRKEVGLVQRTIKQEPVEIYEIEDSPVKVRMKTNIKQEPIEIYEIEDSPVKIKTKTDMPPCSRKRKALTPTSKENAKGRKTFEESIEMIQASTPTKAPNKARVSLGKTFNEPIKTLGKTFKEAIEMINQNEIITIDDSSDDERDVKPSLDVIAVEPRPMKLIPIRKCVLNGPQLRSTDSSASLSSPTTSNRSKDCEDKQTSSTARKSIKCATQASVNYTTPRTSRTVHAPINCNIKSEFAGAAPEFVAIKTELVRVEMPAEQLKQEEAMVNEQTLDDLPEACALTLMTPMISRFEKLRPERLEVQLERYDQHYDSEKPRLDKELEDYSVPAEISKEDENALKVLHGIEDCYVMMKPMQNIYKFAVVGSLGFSKELSTHGIVIKCIKDCGYQEVFFKYKSMRLSFHQHFKKMHADDDDSWHGFCSSCGTYIHNPDDLEDGDDKLTMESELEHIIKCHTRSDITDPSIGKW